MRSPQGDLPPAGFRGCAQAPVYPARKRTPALGGGAALPPGVARCYPPTSTLQPPGVFRPRPPGVANRGFPQAMAQVAVGTEINVSVVKTVDDAEYSASCRQITILAADPS